MKKIFVVGALMGALAAGPALVRAAGQDGKATQSAGTDEKVPTQPPTADPPTVPTGDVALGSVSLPRDVMANGQKLPKGTYQVRVTSRAATTKASGSTPTLERWLEFVKNNEVKGQEVVSIVPDAEIKFVERDSAPKANSSKFELLKGGDYTRLWINKGGNHYLVHFPVA
jgi:hypothetical protein